MIFVTGFARGGTSWLRDCIGSHPSVEILPRERTVFRDFNHPDEIRSNLEPEIRGFDSEKRIVNKAPANAPHIGEAARNFPESRFIFIIRDPRDVLVSHKRGHQKWMAGDNKTVDGCMEKIGRYYNGWLDARDLPNVKLVRYEDLHQNFSETMGGILEFCALDASHETISDIYADNTFQAKTSRSHKEDRDSAKRKGVIGDWAAYLSVRERQWYEESETFSELFREHGYHWNELTYRNILKAMKEADVHFMNEEDILGRNLDMSRVNVVLQHDIDYLNKNWCFDSVIRCAEIENEDAVPAAYNFLPLDDRRYSKRRKRIIKLIRHVKEKNPRSSIGLHVNACERFFPPDKPSMDVDELPHETLDYLHRQVEDYRKEGESFRVATAHGYGRGKRVPNNRDSSQIGDELLRHGIELFDTKIRPQLIEAATDRAALTDVGGVLKPRRFGNGYDLTDPRAYTTMKKGTFIRFLTHPGNYPVDSPSSLAMRTLD